MLNLLIKVTFVLYTTFMSETIDPQPVVLLDKDCFDASQIKPDIIWIAIYQPVWGCDRKTYGNTYQANSRGILKSTEGACGS